MTRVSTRPAPADGRGSTVSDRMSRADISAAVTDLGWRFVLGVVRTSVPVGSLAGAVSADLEIFNPVDGTSVPVGTMSSRCHVRAGSMWSEESLVDMAILFAARRGMAVRIEGVSDPNDPNRELFEDGALLPGPDAILAGPTFEEWLDSTS